MSEQTYLDELELYDRWENKVSLGTLRNWRAAKVNKGPAFVKFGNRVLYPENLLIEYEQKALVRSAAEAGA